MPGDEGTSHYDIASSPLLCPVLLQLRAYPSQANVSLLFFTAFLPCVN